MATTDRAAERQRREIEDWQAGLDALHARIAGRFRRAEVRERVRRSHDRTSGKQAIHMVSAWATANRLVLARVKVDDKSNEITALPELWGSWPWPAVW